MISRAREYLDENGMPSEAMLRSVIAEHRVRAAEMAKLRDAYNGRNTILGRTRRPGLPNNRIAHPYARYITTLATGYMIGQPVTYTMTEENETLAAIQDIFRRGSESAENTQLARDQSIYGKGVEYIHVDEDGLPHTTAVSPENAFVVYTEDCDADPLFGVYYLQKKKADGSLDGWRIWVLGERMIAEYHTYDLGDYYAPKDAKEHYFGGVPLVEYWNDDTEKGDFEWILPLIDAYDTLESDRVNDKEQFVDKLLVLTGAILEEDERGRSPMQQLKEDHALQLPDAQSKAQYLASEMRESDVDVLRQALIEDIHKLSLVPDMSDRNFAANASGVAMRYKLLGFEQLIRVKEQWFREALRTRLKLYAHYMELRGAKALDVAGITILFTHALPVNAQENAQTAMTAMNAGAVSLKTAIAMLHAGEEWSCDDIDREAEAIRQEKSEEALGTVRDDRMFDRDIDEMAQPDEEPKDITEE